MPTTIGGEDVQVRKERTFREKTNNIVDERGSMSRKWNGFIDLFIPRLVLKNR